MKSLLLMSFYVLFFAGSILGQLGWSGTYLGEINGDSVRMELSSKQKGTLEGSMRDSYNTYAIQGVVKDSVFTGTAEEANLGITFNMAAIQRGNALPVQLTMDFLGAENKMEIDFVRKTPGKKSSVPSSQASTTKNPVSSRSRDKQVAGLWSKESNYSSGYGSNNTYGSMSSKEYMEFLPDGRLASGGSSTVIGGSSYTGYTSERGQQIAEGWFWYTEGNKIYLHITQQGQSQVVVLGRYYIENGRMLITAENGEKMLLTRE